MPNYLTNIGIYAQQTGYWNGWTGLTAYYKFNDSSAGTVLDDAIGSANGTLTDTGIWTPMGKNGQGAIFTGNTHYIRCTNTAGISFTGSFSLSFWMYQTGTPSANGGFIIQKQPYPYNYRVSTDNAKNIHFVSALNGNYSVASTTFAGIENNTWYHILCVYNASVGKKLYVNGVERGSTNGTGTLTTGTDTMWLGRYHAATGYEYTGRLDEFGLFGGVALSVTDAQTLYNLGRGIYY